MTGYDRQQWIAKHDHQCEETIRLTNARNHGTRNTRVAFNALMAQVYEHLLVAPEDLAVECHVFARMLLEDYLIGETKAA